MMQLKSSAVMSARATTGSDTTGGSSVVSYEHVQGTISTSGTATATVKLKASFQESKPDFTAAKSPTNRWFYVETINADTGVAVDGSVGYSFAAGDDVIGFSVNQDRITYFNAEVSSISAGAVSVDILGAIN